MSNFIKLTTQSELPAINQVKEFPLGDKTICVANVNGTFSAMDNVCPHRGGPLGQGVIDDGKVLCPWHGWSFDPATGVINQNPNIMTVTYLLKIENGDVMIEI